MPHIIRPAAPLVFCEGHSDFLPRCACKDFSCRACLWVLDSNSRHESFNSATAEHKTKRRVKKKKKKEKTSRVFRQTTEEFV